MEAIVDGSRRVARLPVATADDTARAGCPSIARTLDVCGRFYFVREAVLTDAVIEWLGRTLRPPATGRPAAA